jgi:hypothetical protein
MSIFDVINLAVSLMALAVGLRAHWLARTRPVINADTAATEALANKVAARVAELEAEVSARCPQPKPAPTPPSAIALLFATFADALARLWSLVGDDSSQPPARSETQPGSPPVAPPGSPPTRRHPTC